MNSNEQSSSVTTTPLNTTLDSLPADLKRVMTTFLNDKGYANNVQHRKQTMQIATAVRESAEVAAVITDTMLRTVLGQLQPDEALSVMFSAGLQVGLMIEGKL